MRYASTFLAGSALLAGWCLAAAGCAKAPQDPPAAAPITVQVSYPIQKEVTDYAEFTGRTDAVESVEVRARVWGYLTKVNFKEGALVQKGDVLVELDSRPYQAEYARAHANLALAEAHLARVSADFNREAELFRKKVNTQSDYDLARGNRDEAAATVRVAEAALSTAELNLGFTKVMAPVSGRVSRYMVTVGNMIQSGDQANATLLTNLVSVDPIYAYFDVDEHTVLHVRRLIREGKAKSAREVPMAIALGLANEEGFTHPGTIDFIDNQINPKTGTLCLRGRFPNPGEALLPGLFARVRVPIGVAHPALLISDRAIDTDLGRKIVYVVNDKNEVVARPIRRGLLHDGLRAIEDGLKTGERVIVNGLQAVRPGVTVEAQLTDMPRPGSIPQPQSPAQIQVSQSP
ncbi:MAG: efflux RND transporter periplasmic adaptor subunit [Thermoguttaceae bacterium]